VARLYELGLIGSGLLAASVAYVTNWLALIPWRRSRGQHWTERARRFHPVRVAARVNLWAMPAVFTLASILIWPESSTAWPLIAAFTGLGAAIGTIPMDREVFPRIAVGDLLRQSALGWLLRGLLWFVFLGAATLMPDEFNALAFGIGVAVIGLFVAWNRGGGIWVGRKLGLVLPARERLQRIATGVAAKMDIPFRAVLLLRISTAQALAIPATRTLIFTERLLELLADDEVAAVCRHELGHLTESRFARCQRFIRSLAFMPWLFFKPLLHAWGILAVFGLLLAALAILYLFRSASRRLESRADKIATANETDPGTYARALLKLHEDALLPAVLAKDQATHPHLYDRMLAAGVTPDFPRPEPSGVMAWHGHLFSSAIGIVLVLFAIRLLERYGG
jgi:Zn-dependent protease with chaperone function